MFSRAARLRRWRLFALLVVVAPLLAVATFQSLVAFWPYPNVLPSPPNGKWVEDRHGQMLLALTADDGQWRMPLAARQISPDLMRAIVAVEDARFYRHGGVDWQAVGGAMWQDLSSLRIRRGASTIAMQLHRLRFHTPRTFWGKFEQAVRAVQLEHRESKREILVDYLNRAPFGGNLVGAGAASWWYFGCPCKALSLGQAALLAGLPKNPNRYRPDRHPQAARFRRRIVLDRMLACGMIGTDERARADAEPITTRHRGLPQGNDYAMGAFGALINLAQSSPQAVIQCTIDQSVQQQVYATARGYLRSLAPSGVGAVAVVVLDNSSGECRATVSLANDPTQLDLTQCARSTGSVVKPFIYAAAFEQGLARPDTQVLDTPAAWAGFVPRDFDNAFRGCMTAADALAESRNVPALSLLSRLGVARAVSVMRACGLRTVARNPRRYGLSLAIGGAEATPMEIAEAYATLARGGIHRSVDLAGVHSAQTRVLSTQACLETLLALSDEGRTEQVCPEAAALGVAWKTGTSSDNRDAWCAAVTRNVTVVVWMGNLNDAGSHRLVGAEAAAPLALRLIVTLDPQAQPWNQGLVEAGGDTVLRTSAQRVQLSLISPADGETIYLDPDVSASHQKLLLKAALMGSVQRLPLYWFIDGCRVNPDGAQQLWWMPARGRHRLVVFDRAGHAAHASFCVRGG